MRAIITIGIPCSGKSTWAENFCTKNNFVEINRDNIRMDMFNLERYDDYKFSKDREKRVTKKARELMEACARFESDLVVSDTGLNKGRREDLQVFLETLGYDVEYKVFDIEFFDALKRNDKRTDKTIPRSVMYDMYRHYMEYKEEQGEWTKYVSNNGLPSAYIVDIDGTLAFNDGCRGWYEWDKVGLDKPIQATIDIINGLARAGNLIILLSGRDSTCRKETIDWLNKHGVHWDGLYMRPEGSMDKDRDVKQVLFNENVKDFFNVRAVFDDRPQVCLLWHDLGIPLFKVGDPILEF